VRKKHWPAEHVATLFDQAFYAEGITQAELARRLGMSPSMVSRVLSGERGISLALLARFAEALGCELDLRLVPAGKLKLP